MNSYISKVTSILGPIIEVVISSLAVFIIIYIFIASPHIVVGDSMEPNFLDGEFILADNLSYRFSNPQRGDVVILQYDATQEFIKRIIGLPGDTVRIDAGQVYINGKVVDESAYIQPSKNPTLNLATNPGTFLTEDVTKTVPQGEYLVLGDNRGVSKDSRYIGWIAKNALRGKAIIVYFPLNKAELVPKVVYTNTQNTISTHLR